MFNYETLMLARTEITDDELTALERQLDKIVSDKKGKMTLFDRWGKYKLAYPVSKNLYGIYILARYQVPKESLKSCFDAVDTLFKIKYNELVMRHVTVKLADDVSSVYKYPEALGTHRTSNLDSFIKENKMEGLIDTPVENSPEEAAQAKPEAKPVEKPAETVVDAEAADDDNTSTEGEA